MSLIAPSILSADFSKLGQEIKDVEKAGADWIHIDVMDGHFVPNITYGPIIVETAKKVTDLPLDVHLMIEKPDLMIPDFAKSGADYISVHSEACIHLNRSLQLIKSFNIKAGVALNPATPLTDIEWVLEDLDYIVIMSVNPGFGGQSFIDNSINRIITLKKMINSVNPEIIIQVDGGVNRDTIKNISEAGAKSFVAGSAIFKSDRYESTIHELKMLSGNTDEK